MKAKVLMDKLRDRIMGISKHFTTQLMVNKVASSIAVLRVKAL